MWTLVLGGLTVGTVVRIEWVDRLADQGFLGKYVLLADQALQGELEAERLADVSTGYLGVVLAARAVGMSVDQLRGVQIAAVTAAALLCGLAARRLWGDAAGVTAAVALLASRAALVNATDIEPETLVLLIDAAALAALLPARSWRGEFAGGVLLGLSALVRPTILPVAALLALWAGWRARAGSRRYSPLVAVTATAGGAVLPLVLLRIALAGAPGVATPMNPGTVLFEGWNPQATGAAGEAPRIVKDIEHTIDAPDALHLAYRVVAGRATGLGPSPEVSNRYWFDRAVVFVTTEPAAALRLLGRKLRLLGANHDVWDLRTMFLKDGELARGPWLPFTVLVCVAAAGAALSRRHPSTPALLLFVAGTSAVLLLFYVTSRQRNALLPALSILAGAALHEGVVRWRRGHRGRVLTGVMVTAATAAVLSVPANVAREDLHTWRLAVDSTQAVAMQRRQGGVAPRVASALALTPGAAPPLPALRVAIAEELRHEPPPERVFDLAVAAVRAGDCATAVPLLDRLAAIDYRPLRGIDSVSSVAWHRAVCALRQRDLDVAATLVGEARREAAGDADVLALAAVVAELRSDALGWRRAAGRLDLLHDPFTARLALATAYAEAGDDALARLLVEGLDTLIPEWGRPRRMLDSITARTTEGR